ncbi:MAG: tetratricopeptide repeat protein, partial [Muribaculaceae bacterium]|nr:tetratricopeptide repeat protein [Muribaculaceae bacterium]
MNSLKKIIGIAAICLTAAIPARANIVAEADSAYISDDFTRAITLYSAAIDSLGPSAERYYNLGNAYFRADKPGMAIVSYERALRLDPSNNDVRDNLEFVKSRVTDRIESGDSFISNSIDS